MKFLEEKKKRKTFFVLCAIIFVISILSVWWVLCVGKTPGTVVIACVYQDGTLLHEINLDEVEESYILEVTGEDGEVNRIEVRHGEIGMVSASCPDALCVQMGFIKSAGMPVTCLPNKVVIEIVEREQKNTVDGAVY